MPFLFLQYRAEGDTDWISANLPLITGLTNETTYEVSIIAWASANFYQSARGTATGTPTPPPPYKTWMLRGAPVYAGGSIDNQWLFRHSNNLIISNAAELKKWDDDNWEIWVTKTTTYDPQTVDLTDLLNASIGSIIRFAYISGTSWAEGTVSAAPSDEGNYIKVPIAMESYRDSGNLVGGTFTNASIEIYNSITTWVVDGKAWVLQDAPDTLLTVNDKVLVVGDKVLVLEK